MNRYLSSFVITATLYAVCIATLINFMNNHSCDANSEVATIKVMKISLINLKQEIKPTKIEKNKKIVKKAKPIKNPIVKKKTEVKKVPEIVKTIPVQLAQEIAEVAPVLEEELLAELAVEESLEEIEKIRIQTAASNEKTLIAEQELQERQKSFFLNLRELINKNKSYPNTARRRAVQGNVEVCFCILENGNVENIEQVSGKSIFKKSALQAIQRSFPIDVDKTLFSFPKKFKITISYVLK